MNYKGVFDLHTQDWVTVEIIQFTFIVLIVDANGK